MPARALKRLSVRLSRHFYPYGRVCASGALPLLLASLAFIYVFSYPIVSNFIHFLAFKQPASALSRLDGSVWQLSTELGQHTNATPAPEFITTHPVIIQQIRILNHERTITPELVSHALDLENALSTTIVNLGNKPHSLASICLQRQGHCVVHSPQPYWHHQHTEIANEFDWIATVNSATDAGVDSAATGLSMHPLSVFGNVSLNDRDGRFLSADSIILSVFLQQRQHYDVLKVWDALWSNVASQLNIAHNHNSPVSPIAWHKQINTQTQIMQFTPKSFLYLLPPECYAYGLIFVAAAFVVSRAFGNAHLFRSQFGLGLAAVFMCTACFTTSWGILKHLHITFQAVPTWLLLLVPIVASFENVFLLTNAVLSAGCDMPTKEKMGRGMESVGVPMTVTLIAELTILAIGEAMDSPLINDFCVYARTILLVGYLLEITFFVSVLALNVKRVELVDLDDRQMSKRLRELAQCDPDVDRPPDYCPIQEPVTLDTEPKTCAECKHFKTHRTFNALMLCLVILALTLLQPSSRIPRRHTELGLHEQLSSLSNKFWASVNPQHHSMWLQVNPPYLVSYTSDPQQHLEQAQFYEEYFATKKTMIQEEPAKQPARPRSRFRQFLYESVTRMLCLLAVVNFPSILLCIALVIIIMWLTPPWRDQWLVPFLKTAFIEVINGIRYYLKRTVQMLPESVSSRITSEKSEYDENGVHRGAISAQNQFNQLNKSHVSNVQVKTLSGKHTADVHQLAVNAKHGTVVSCGQDGRIVMWDADQGEWMARLDRLRQTSSGLLEGDLNPLYWRAATKRHLLQRQSSGNRRPSKQMMPARCIKIDQGNKWIASAFDDGVIRVWDTTTGTIVRELRVETEIPVVMEDDPAQERSELRRRHQTAPASHATGTGSAWNHPQRRMIDRVVAIQFVGAVAEYCHPLVAEAAARQRTTTNASIEDNSSQNFLVSVHKSGTIREWNILYGECTQVISTGHDRDITALHVVECKAPHRKLGVTWVFTASKDGVVKCWERRLVKNNCSASNTSTSGSSVGDELSVNEDEQTTAVTAWTCLYSLNGHNGSPITALTTESPVGGMGALVTASANGFVKVWNFETGDAVCTLSRGKQRKESASGLRFRKHSPYDEDEDDSNKALDAHMGNLHGPISQVVVSRYCEVEQGPGLCRGCDTCFGNGFLIAACSPDDSVHVWRLERADGRHEGSCTLCSKDYHRKATLNRQRNPAMDEPLATEPTKVVGRRRRPSVSKVATRRVFRHIKPSRSFGTASSDGDTPSNIEDGLLDIEQLGGEQDIALAPTFLGKIEQLGGRGIVFCNNMILAGVRKKLDTSSDNPADKVSNEWEAWFASLQYYEAPAVDDDRTEPPSIPVDTFALEKPVSKTQKRSAQEEPQGRVASVWRALTGKSKCTPKRDKKNESPTFSDDDMQEDEDDTLELDEADEMLPFSAVRHVVPLDGSGLGCDYGNFIKLVYLDDKCKRRRLFGMPDQMDTKGVGRRLSSMSVASAAAAAEAAAAAGAGNMGGCGESCQCGSDASSSSASPLACCGGANKRNGRCCGGTSKQRGRSNPRGRTTKKIVLATASSPADADYNTTTRLTPARSAAACTVGNAADCSVANCSRAAECHLAPAASTSSTRFGLNWALS